MAGYEEEVYDQIGTWPQNGQPDANMGTYQEAPAAWRRTAQQQGILVDLKQSNPVTLPSGFPECQPSNSWPSYNQGLDSTYIYPSPTKQYASPTSYHRVQQQAVSQNRPRPTYAQALGSRPGPYPPIAQTLAASGTSSYTGQQGGQTQRQSDTSAIAQAQWSLRTQAPQSTLTQARQSTLPQAHQSVLPQSQTRSQSYAEAARRRYQPRQIYPAAVANGAQPPSDPSTAPQQPMTSRIPLQNRVDPRQQPNWHLHMQRDYPSNLKAYQGFSQENTVNVNQSYMSTLPEWLNVPKVPGERGQPVSNAAYDSANQIVRSPTKSTTSSSRRTKAEIVSSGCAYKCGVCQAGFDDVSDLRYG